MISLSASLKRIAWAYGCAKIDSPAEEKLRALLLLKVQALLKEAPATPATPTLYLLPRRDSDEE